MSLLSILVTLRAGVETEASRTELEVTLGRAGTIAGACSVDSGAEGSEEGVAASLTRLTKGTRRAGSPLLATGACRRRPSSHHGDRSAANGGALTFPLPMKP
jgi:hypothetical protein